ncbi:MAG: small subunit ribosomal protein S17 [Candidatus Paceibacteria bacterium]|jgi:small subunit ribosomal protein S17
MEEIKKQNDTEVKVGKTLKGVVVSSKNKDTAVVEVERYFKHKTYGKFIKSKKKYQTHDEGNVHEVGTKVEIKECRPVSKTKHFSIVK